MYAIVDIAGQQVKVEKGQKILVHRLEGEKGSKVDFDQVLLITQEGKTSVGNPVLDGAQVQATILDHVKGDKVFVFKKKRRKGFKRFNGHRQYLSLLAIEEILETGATPKKEAKKEVKKEVAEAPKAPKAKAKEVEAPVEEAPKKKAAPKAKKSPKAEAKPEKKKAEKKEETPEE